MLSYRHAFHAGNHADVLKHLVLVQVLHHLTQKDKPIRIIDTHAGAGFYSLEHGFAAERREYTNGISALFALPRNERMPEAVGDYLSMVRRLNPNGIAKKYPGSPYIALQWLRRTDQLYCFEKHSQECRLLRANFDRNDRRVMISPGDGFEGMRALLPPPSRRGLVLIDPSYETREDYYNVVAALKDGLRRFATGVYILWYPLLPRTEARRLPDKLCALPAANWLDATLSIRAPGGAGAMAGSGVFIINPPWLLEARLREALSWLAGRLALDSQAGFTLRSKAV